MVASTTHVFLWDLKLDRVKSLDILINKYSSESGVSSQMYVDDSSVWSRVTDLTYIFNFKVISGALTTKCHICDTC